MQQTSSSIFKYLTGLIDQTYKVDTTTKISTLTHMSLKVIIRTIWK